jgi:hypothetical protein
MREVYSSDATFFRDHAGSAITAILEWMGQAHRRNSGSGALKQDLCTVPHNQNDNSGFNLLRLNHNKAKFLRRQRLIIKKLHSVRKAIK